MWLFLATEILMFGGLFVGFALQQSAHPQAFLEAHHHLDKTLGALNTVVLLLSSFTMVMAVWSAQHGRQKALIRYLLVTLGCALVFLIVKGFDTISSTRPRAWSLRSRRSIMMRIGGRRCGCRSAGNVKRET